MHKSTFRFVNPYGTPEPVLTLPNDRRPLARAGGQGVLPGGPPEAPPSGRQAAPRAREPARPRCERLPSPRLHPPSQLREGVSYSERQQSSTNRGRGRTEPHRSREGRLSEPRDPPCPRSTGRGVENGPPSSSLARHRGVLALSAAVKELSRGRAVTHRELPYPARACSPLRTVPQPLLPCLRRG